MRITGKVNQIFCLIFREYSLKNKGQPLLNQGKHSDFCSLKTAYRNKKRKAKIVR